jgi:hypothetical protein
MGSLTRGDGGGGVVTRGSLPEAPRAGTRRRLARAELSIDAPPVRALALSPALILQLAAACGRAPDPTTTAPPAESAFSRARFAADGADAGSAEPPVPTTADPAALEEILAAVPKTPPRPAADATSARPPEATPAGRVKVGEPSAAPDVSNPALERAARAQLYWPLVQRCHDRDGGLLPPEAVHVSFRLDADGYPVASTILATPRQPRFADAARCMERELGAATFRAPASARGRPHTFQTDVPAVD